MQLGMARQELGAHPWCVTAKLCHLDADLLLVSLMSERPRRCVASCPGSTVLAQHPRNEGWPFAIQYSCVFVHMCSQKIKDDVQATKLRLSITYLHLGPFN